MKFKINKEHLKSLANLKAKKVPKRGTIVLVDDEPSNLYALETTLEDEFEILTFSDPTKALETLQTKNVDVIISDQRMPEMLGTEFLAQTMDFNSDNVRIILTGYTDVKDLVRCINEGLIYRYLVKPWDKDEIIAIARQALDLVQHERTLKQIIPSTVIRRLFPDGVHNAKPGEGRKLACACMFVDIRQFTQMADEMSADETFRFLTSFMGAVAPRIREHHGFIDKYLGDGIMGVFDREGHAAADATACALSLIETIKEYNTEHRSSRMPGFREGGIPRVPVGVGIGLHAGEVILGTIGFPGRLEFTILGDVVNTTSRVQGLAKSFDASILVHESIAERLPEEGFARRYLGRASLRGKRDRVGVWEVFENDPPEMRERKTRTRDALHQALEKLENGDTENAKTELMALHQAEPDDVAFEFQLDWLFR